MTTANRGKAAEAAVKKILSSMESASMTSARWPDARSGSFVTAPCDFVALRKGKFVLLEVKAVEHEYRLPHKNASPDQIARMRNWEAAGADAWVLVHFAPLKLWRTETVGYFLQREGGSWDMRHLEARPLNEIMLEIFQ